jgi:hypothetical protein
MNFFFFLSMHARSLRLKSFGRNAAIVAALPVLSMGFSTAARADLGGAPTLPDSAALSSTAVQSLQGSVGTIALSASTGSTAASTYTVRESTLANGTVVREYLNVDGTVFAAVFSGQFLTDLQSLIGSSAFTQYADARAAAHAAETESGIQRGRGSPVNVQASNLVVQITGHPGAFFGRAWIPTLLPSGMNTSDIK